MMRTKYDGQLPENFRMIVTGSSSTGKSTFVRKILDNENGLLRASFERIIYLKGAESEACKSLQAKYGKDAFLVFNGIPEEDVLLPLCKAGKRTVLIIEDLDDAACSSHLISQIFKAHSHHFGFCVIISMQNMFCPGRERLNLVRSASHLVLFQTFLDSTVIRTIAQRVFPSNPSALVNLFEQLTVKPHGYLSIWGNCDKVLKFRSHITEPIQKVYQYVEKTSPGG